MLGAFTTIRVGPPLTESLGIARIALVSAGDVVPRSTGPSPRVCRGCGAYTQPRNAEGDAYRYCKRWRPGAIQRKWTGSRSVPHAVERD
jgi:hypothetical protein